MIELESMAPGRAWRALAEFSVGQPWPLTIHQIRRSTAIYAIRSGIVSLPALKHILHHITIEMSLYYARGSSFARDLLKESSNSKSAFVHVYQSAELQVRAWQYANEFILTDEVLHGPHGLWLKGKAKDSSKTIPYAELLEDTLKRMKRGELHYQPTPVGGCTSGEVCHKRISVNFLGCDGCKSAAIKPSKVLKLIEVQKVLVSHCDVDSPERNAENQTLFELTEFAQTMGISA
ncbi:integrase [Pseudomonas monteilii]|uniref:Integrase n=1 Tax=Pseudomonas monteilii TaxID=76759 RepID=A0A399M6B8_9PSED|nr:integrase [Pseudomonas monteilii]